MEEYSFADRGCYLRVFQTEKRGEVHLTNPYFSVFGLSMRPFVL